MGEIAGRKRERQHDRHQISPESERPYRKQETSFSGEQYATVFASASSLPTSHPVEDLFPDEAGGPAKAQNTALNGEPGDKAKSSAPESLPRSQSRESPVVLRHDEDTGASCTPMPAPAPPHRHKLNSGQAAENKDNRQAARHQVSTNHLSFGEEVAEEQSEPAMNFSLAQSTTERFQNEREIQLPTAKADAVAPSASLAGLTGLQMKSKKTLGPIYFGVVQARGPRPYMEDRYTIISSYVPLSFTSQPLPDDVMRSFAAVYDGHNGSRAAEHACSRLHMVLAQEPALRTCTGESNRGALAWARQHSDHNETQEAVHMGKAVKHAFSVVDQEILDRARSEQGRDGSTALIVMRIGEVIWAAHAGDSRAVLCRSGKAVRLTEDHKPDLASEKARVEAAGGKVDFQRCWRVICPARQGRPASGLAVSRSLGDLDFKEPSRFIESEPDVTRIRATDEDSFVVMASDGLWDVISDQEAVTIVQECLLSGIPTAANKAALDLQLKEAAQKLLDSATSKGSMDNITVLLLLLQWH